jgi:L-fuculose-phosphate aldolase
MSRSAAADGIVHVCRLLWERGLIAGPDGNVSVRLDRDTILITPAGLSKRDVTADDLVEVSLDGEARHRDRRPSSEILMHLRAYKVRADVAAVVHAHPPVATAFAVAGIPIMDDVLPEVILQMGTVALVPYATPGTTDLPNAMEPFLRSHDALLLANHGATTVGPTLSIAHQRMESLEHAARIIMNARLLGNVNVLPSEMTGILRDSYEKTAGRAQPLDHRGSGAGE